MKKVVKAKKKTVYKYPEFNRSKIYICEDGSQLIELETGFTWVFKNCTKGSFITPNFEYAIKILQGRKAFILDNQKDLARYIMGCREFPELKENKEIIKEPICENEVDIDDYNNGKIYAYTVNNHFFQLQKIDGWCFYNITHNMKMSYSTSRPVDCISHAIEHHDVYEFDTEKEFLEQAYKWVAGK